MVIPREGIAIITEVVCIVYMQQKAHMGGACNYQCVITMCWVLSHVISPGLTLCVL